MFSTGKIYRARRLLEENRGADWRLDLDELRGRLTELCADMANPHVTGALRLVHQAQRSGGPAAWIGPSTSIFYPPDAAGWRLDWSALAIIALDGVGRRARAADRLLRSGGFELVVIDLCRCRRPQIASALLGRLLHLAEAHDSAVVFLTNSSGKEPSISSLISTRAHARWSDVDVHRLRARFTTVKDKRRGPGQSFCEVYDGPLGLR